MYMYDFFLFCCGLKYVLCLEFEEIDFGCDVGGVMWILDCVV